VAVVVSLAFAGSLHAAAGELPPKGRFGVGDSIMLSAEDEFAAVETPVNAVVGRQFSTGLKVIRWRIEHAVVPRVLIVHLGTNGPIDPADCDELVTLAAPRRVFLVTVRVPRSWRTANNLTLEACADRYERAYLIRWSAHSSSQTTWFAEDGYHLTAEGQLAYVAFVDAKVDATLEEIRAAR
jgi:hypothetical protein